MSIDWGSINSEVDLKLHWPPDPWSALETEWARREEALDTIQTQLEGPHETVSDVHLSEDRGSYNKMAEVVATWRSKFIPNRLTKEGHTNKEKRAHT